MPSEHREYTTGPHDSMQLPELPPEPALEQSDLMASVQHHDAEAAEELVSIACFAQHDTLRDSGTLVGASYEIRKVL